MSDTVFDVYFPCFGDISLSLSLSVSLSLSLSLCHQEVLIFLLKCMSRRLMPHETHGWLRTCKVVRDYGMCQAWKVIMKSASCDDVVKYTRTVYRHSWFLLATWSQNPERVP